MLAHCLPRGNKFQIRSSKNIIKSAIVRTVFAALFSPPPPRRSGAKFEKRFSSLNIYEHNIVCACIRSCVCVPSHVRNHTINLENVNAYFELKHTHTHTTNAAPSAEQTMKIYALEKFCAIFPEHQQLFCKFFLTNKLIPNSAGKV